MKGKEGQKIPLSPHESENALLLKTENSRLFQKAEELKANLTPFMLLKYLLVAVFHLCVEIYIQQFVGKTSKSYNSDGRNPIFIPQIQTKMQ